MMEGFQQQQSAKLVKDQEEANLWKESGVGTNCAG